MLCSQFRYCRGADLCPLAASSIRDAEPPESFRNRSKIIATVGGPHVHGARLAEIGNGLLPCARPFVRETAPVVALRNDRRIVREEPGDLVVIGDRECGVAQPEMYVSAYEQRRVTGRLASELPAVDRLTARGEGLVPEAPPGEELAALLSRLPVEVAPVPEDPGPALERICIL